MSSSIIHQVFISSSSNSASIVATSTRKRQRYRFYLVLLRTTRGKDGLSKHYTNHSIRVTSLQVLEDLNIEGRHIIRISGHKSVNSVENYARCLSASRKRNISASFMNHLSVSSDSGPSCSKLRKHDEPVVEKENCVTTASKNIVDFEVGDAAIDHTLLSQLPSHLLKSFNSSLHF